MKNFFAAIVALIVTTSAFATVFAAALFDTPYIGNKFRMTFHYRDCPSVAQMNPNNQLPLNSVEEALAQGYRPCGNCKPWSL